MARFKVEVDTRAAERAVARNLRWAGQPMRGRTGRRIAGEMKGSARDELRGSYWQQGASRRTAWEALHRIPGQRHRKPFGGASGRTAARWRGADVRIDADSVTLTARVPGFHVGGTGTRRSTRPSRFTVRDRGHQRFLGIKLGWWPRVGETVTVTARPMASTLSEARRRRVNQFLVEAWGRA